MPYSHFTLVRVQQELGLSENWTDLFPKTNPILPSTWLQETLKKGERVALFSEKARSELMVMPILIEIQAQFPNSVAIYSGALIEGDKDKDLNGECDFILSNTPQSLEVQSPIFCVVEAKDNNIRAGLGQCVAQMLGVRFYNRKQQKPHETIFGCITTGTEWQFIKLEADTYHLDEKRYYLSNLPNILGVLAQIVKENPAHV